MKEYKTCSKCGQILHFTNFNKFARSKDGLSAWCKSCNKSYQKEHRLKNLDLYDASAKAWRAKNKDYLQTYNSSYYVANKQRLGKQNSDWRNANRKRKNQADRKWAKANKDKVKVNQANWRKRNPEKASLFRQKRRARLQNAKMFLVTSKDLQKIMMQCCLYCGGKSSHIDHIMPLSRGGMHSIGNLAPACSACNLSKNNKTIMEWKVWRQRLDSDA